MEQAADIAIPSTWAYVEQGHTANITNRVASTVGRMLADRGYNRNASAAQSVCSGEMPTINGLPMSRCMVAVTKENTTGEPPDHVLYVWMMQPGLKIGINHLRQIQDHIASDVDMPTRSIVITDSGTTPAAIKAVNDPNDQMPELFTLTEMMTNRIYHKMQPRFREVADQTEIDHIKQKYCIEDEDSWVKILSSDFVVRYFAWAPDTIVECTRTFPGLHQITYRKVT